MKTSIYKYASDDGYISKIKAVVFGLCCAYVLATAAIVWSVLL